MKKLATLLTLTLATSVAAQNLAPNTVRIHYQRPDNTYTGWGLHAWEDTTAQVEWSRPLAQTGKDEFGVFWDVPLKEGAKKLGFIVHNGDNKDPGPDLWFDLSKGRELFIKSGSATAAYAKAGPFDVDATKAVEAALAPADPPVPAGVNRINYYRPDGKYDGWGLHAWEDTTLSVDWARPLLPTGTNAFGLYWDVPMKTDWKKLGFIVHKGDEKDPGPDMFLTPDKGNQVWIVSGKTEVLTTRPDISVRKVGDLTKQQAIMLSRDLIAVKPELVQDGAQYTLFSAQDASLKLTPEGVRGGITLTLEEVPGGLNAAQKARFPYLAAYKVLQVRAEDRARIPEALRGQLALQSAMPNGTLLDVTGVQTANALDDLYAYDGPLGVTWDKNGDPGVRLWAPTAQTVDLLLSRAGDKQEMRLPLQRTQTGIWEAVGINFRTKPGLQRTGQSLKGWRYRFEVKVFAPSTGKIETNVVTDPYSVALTLNSTHSVFADLNDNSQKPAGWDSLKKPALRSVSDLSFYELHLRDFSVGDPSVPAGKRGSYLAFTEQNSSGMKHLKALADAGLKAIHLLPTFDIATVNEDKAQWKTPGDLSKFAPNSEEQQKAINAVRDADAYNWGYDPYHYMTPEGSYAVNPDQRTREYRQMVMALNGAGLRVVQDVVFNHTHASGQAERSVLDRIVPGYYHRLNVNGGVENSTCCSNTATEHRMMRKLMIDTLVLMAKQYKVDGFRFDLMGHHLVSDMQAARAALDALTLQKDGVNGKQIYLYGEGWDFGEVQGNKRGPNATQTNLYGQGIGTFNDRLRDAVRGGNPFGGLQEQGFATGLFTLPNGQAVNTSQEKLLQLTDLVKVGLTGNLRDYSLVSATGAKVTGAKVTGASIDYNGAAAGYAASPREAINYVSAHDNQTLYDAVLLKAPAKATPAQRTRMQNLANSVVLLGQGLPFSQAGDDLLRSKSFDTDSYNSGDWFNTLDWSGKTNGFERGLPPAEKNEGHWPLYRQMLGNPALTPSPADIQRAFDHYREMLRIRYSSTLFRMTTAAEVQQGLTFLSGGPHQTPGLIVMKLSGAASPTNPYRNIVVVFNGSGQAIQFKDTQLAGLRLDLHPVLKNSTDLVVKQSKYQGSSVSVPGLTTAVFVGK